MTYPQPIHYRNVSFYPPVALAQENGQTVMQLFSRLRENQKDLTAEKIISEILANTKDNKLVFAPLVFDVQLHDPKIHQQFPIVWDLKKNDAIADNKEKRAIALSPHVDDQNKINLWLSPSTVIVGYQSQQPFMIVTGKAIPETDPKISFYSEQIAENFLDIGYQPAVNKFMPGMLYHKSVFHLKKLCPHDH